MPCVPHVVSPSRLAAASLGLEPLGIPWGGPGEAICALEARTIAAGELVMPWKAKDNFMDQLSTVHSPIANGYAEAVMSRPVLNNVRNMVFCSEGAFPLNRDEARAWFFLTPPKPPFLAVFANTKSQHLIWRTPVNYDRNFYIFRHGPDLLSVRLARLRTMTEALSAYDGDAFWLLDRERKDPRHGVLRSGLPAELVALLSDVSPGELMALATLAKRHPPEPRRPEPLRLSTHR